jgi:ABC-type Mn2+/Zn2+ transport system permease subunit
MVVLKRVVFVGAALAEIAAAGLALGFYLGLGAHGRGAPAISFAVTLAASVLFAYPSRNRVLPQESLIALGFVVGSAAGLVLVSKSAEGLEELKHLLSGHLLTARPDQTLFDLLVFIILIAIYMTFYKEILYVSFDPETAHSAGMSPRRWNLVFYLVLGVVIAVATRAAGTLLVVAYLVLPAAGALVLVRRMLSAQLAAVLLAALGTLAGVCASFIWDVPAGASITLALFALVGICLGAASLRKE